MSHDRFRDETLRRYLDEELPVDEMAVVERSLRDSEDLRRRVGMLLRRRDQGGHSVGEIWRRRRISCPTRAELGSHLLGVLDVDHARYVEFHLRDVGCRICASNLRDLETAAAEEQATTTRRRRRYFESSAGLLRSSRDDSGRPS